MANQKHYEKLRTNLEMWNKWRDENSNVKVDLSNATLNDADLRNANLSDVNLFGANLWKADLSQADLTNANLRTADLGKANLRGASLRHADFSEADLSGADLSLSGFEMTNSRGARFVGCNFTFASVVSSTFGNSDLSEAIGLELLQHQGPSGISTDALALSKGKIPEIFLQGCGLSDWEIEEVKLYKPDLSNTEVNEILYRMYELRATQALQISPLFVSYSHADSGFVNKIGDNLTEKGIRYWRDIHDLKAGRMEKQIDRAIRQNPTVLLILSSNCIKSDWVEHEVRTARALEKEMGRDVLCPIALDDTWKSSRWPKRVMEQVMNYNILDFSEWKDDSKFEDMFRKLINGLELFYKG